jgi:hypothetical protein
MAQGPFDGGQALVKNSVNPVRRRRDLAMGGRKSASEKFD